MSQEQQIRQGRNQTYRSNTVQTMHLLFVHDEIEVPRVDDCEFYLPI
jgi:hypothetical protein